MKTLVGAIWCLIGYAAFLACIYTLNDIGAGKTVMAWLFVGFVVLGYATWRTHGNDE